MHPIQRVYMLTSKPAKVWENKQSTAKASNIHQTSAQCTTSRKKWPVVWSRQKAPHKANGIRYDMSHSKSLGRLLVWEHVVRAYPQLVRHSGVLMNNHRFLLDRSKQREEGHQRVSGQYHPDVAHLQNGVGYTTFHAPFCHMWLTLQLLYI